jgi:regulator of protease activity HflC (stomatin/prohibitin superfamily)
VNPKQYNRKLIFVTAGALVGLASFFTLLGAIRTVSTGHIGVVSLFGKVYTEDSLSEGIHLINPFCGVHELSVRTEVYTMSSSHAEGQKLGDDSIKVISNDDLEVPMDVSVPYRLIPTAAPWVYRNFGITYEDQIVRSAARTGVRLGAAKFSAKEGRAEKREEIAKEMLLQIESAVSAILAKYKTDADNKAPENVFVFSELMLRQIGIPEKVKAAIELKLQAEQRAQQVEFETKQATAEIEKKTKEAEGQSAYNTKVTASLTPELLKYKAIEALNELAKSPNTKVLILGNNGPAGQLPFVVDTAGK